MTEDLVNFDLPTETSSIIKVIGAGGGGCNAVNHMFEEGICGVDYIICNTDAQALENSPVPIKIQLGVTLTEGRGAGNKPEMGEQAALENYEDLRRVLEDNTKMLFIAAGMGGGTGTGAAPVIAKLARELDILTIAVVTIPSPAEGKKRYQQAQDGILKLKEYVDSMLVISNDRLHNIYGDLPASKAFKMADNIITTAVKGVAEIITVHGNVNIDYTDVHTVMHQSEVFIMGTGFGEGEGRAMQAVNAALEHPLLDSNDIYGTKNILLNIISGKEEISIGEIGEIIDTLQERAGQEADIIWGNGRDERLGNKISVTIIATGFKTNPNRLLQPEVQIETYELEPEELKEPEVSQKTIQSWDDDDAVGVYSSPDEMDDEEVPIIVKPTTKPTSSGSSARKESKRRGEGKKRKSRKDEAISESSVDKWFFRNFGLGKIFDAEDEE